MKVNKSVENSLFVAVQQSQRKAWCLNEGPQQSLGRLAPSLPEALNSQFSPSLQPFSPPPALWNQFPAIF